VLDDAEVEHFDEVVVGTEPANEDIGGLDVAVNETVRVCLFVHDPVPLTIGIPMPGGGADRVAA
jgi:hypothetical protein